MKKEKEDLSIREAGFPIQLVHALEKYGLFTLQSLRETKEDVLAKIPRIGIGSVGYIKGFIAGFDQRENR